MYKVTFTDENGNKRKMLINDESAWMSHGNFSGMGKFSKLKVVKIDEQNKC